MIKGKKQLFSAIMSASIIAPNAINAYADISVANEVRTITIMEVVKTNSLNVRAGAGTKYNKIGTLKKGQRVEVTSISNGWAKFNYNGRIGYISTSYLNKVQDTTSVVKKQMTVKVDDLSVRKGAGTSYTKLGSLNKGDIVVVVQELSNGWVKIEYKNGFGYVSNKSNAYLDNVSTSNPSEPSVPNQPSNPDVNVVKYTTNEALNLRKTASWSGEKLAVIKGRVEVEAISESNGWIKINYNGVVGYLPTSHVTKVESSSTPSQPSKPEVEKKKMVVKVDDLSVRAGSSTKYKKIGSLNKGDKVTIIEELSNGWVKIEFNNGYGYISNVKGAYLEESVNTNQEKADKVIAMIDALKDKADITLDDYETVMNVKKAYNDLTEEEQVLVKNSSKLTDIEAKIRELEELEFDKYNEIIEIIRTFEEKVTVINVAQERAKLDEIIAIANTMHWSEAQNLPQKSIEDKKIEIELIEKQIENAQRVTNMIKALNKDLTIDDKDEVVDVRTAYESLTQEEKDLVVNESILIEAERKIELLENPVNPDAVKTMIDDLNKTIDITDEDAIKKARMYYDSLTEDQKNEVGDIGILESAENQMKSIMDRIGNVLNLISNLPVEIKIEHRQEVMEAKNAFDNLSLEEQKKIAFTDRGILESAIAKISSLDKIEADRQIVAELINRINLLRDKEINIDEHEEEIKDIRAIYDNLEYIRQDEVTNYEELLNIESKLHRIYEAVIYLEGLIIELPEQIEREHIAIVEEAKKRYEDLGNKNQSKVKSEYKLKLERAIEQSNALK